MKFLVNKYLRLKMGEWFVLFLLIVVVLFAVMVSQAPEGWEDEDGFHYGNKFEQDQIKENNKL